MDNGQWTMDNLWRCGVAHRAIINLPIFFIPQFISFFRLVRPPFLLVVARNDFTTTVNF